jgi:hypothetical protein
LPACAGHAARQQPDLFQFRDPDHHGLRRYLFRFTRSRASLCNLESIFQLYPATLLARLVTLEIAGGEGAMNGMRQIPVHPDAVQAPRGLMPASQAASKCRNLNGKGTFASFGPAVKNLAYEVSERKVTGQSVRKACAVEIQLVSAMGSDNTCSIFASPFAISTVNGLGTSRPG